MEPKQKPTSPNFGAAAVIGLTVGVTSLFFISQCPSSEPRRGNYRPQAQSQPYQAPIRPESAVAELPYNTTHKVGGLELEYLRRDYGAEARIRYDLGSIRIDTGMRLRGAGQGGTLPINETDLQVRINVNSIDEQKINVSVTVEPRQRRD